VYQLAHAVGAIVSRAELATWPRVSMKGCVAIASATQAALAESWKIMHGWA
jgi:hypothetical protein